jgi:hypothetical protein
MDFALALSGADAHLFDVCYKIEYWNGTSSESSIVVDGQRISHVGFALRRSLTNSGISPCGSEREITSQLTTVKSRQCIKSAKKRHRDDGR